MVRRTEATFPEVLSNLKYDKSIARSNLSTALICWPLLSLVLFTAPKELPALVLIIYTLQCFRLEGLLLSPRRHKCRDMVPEQALPQSLVKLFTL